MAKFNKSSSIGGAWLDKKNLKDGDVIKLVSEAKEEEGQNGPQIVAKCLVKGGEKEPKNVGINKPSKNGLIEAFGEDSTSWMEKKLTVKVEKTVVGGKRGIALYLVPEGFEVTEDDGGYVVVKRIGEGGKPLDQSSEDPNPDDIPF